MSTASQNPQEGQLHEEAHPGGGAHGLPHHEGHPHICDHGHGRHHHGDDHHHGGNHDEHHRHHDGHGDQHQDHAEHHEHRSKYFVNIEGKEYPWDHATISVPEIRKLGSMPPGAVVLEINLEDNTERTLGDHEVVQIKPGHGFAKKVCYQRGRRR